jgi:hypothetical protein
MSPPISIDPMPVAGAAPGEFAAQGIATGACALD